MSEQELQEYLEGMNACWKLFKKYATTGDPDSAEYWESIINEADAIYMSTDKTVIRRLLFELLKVLEKREKSA